MYALSSSQLLDVWEAGRARGQVERGLLLLHAVRPELDREAALDMTIGERDGHLLKLRAATFGHSAALVAQCNCGERLEFELPLGRLVSEDGASMPARCSLAHGAYRAHFRLPTSRDLAALRRAPDVESAVRTLALCCVIGVERDGSDASGEPLPDELLLALAEAMQEADPRAYVSAAFSCPACGSTFSEPLDLVACLWTELSANAVRTLREVHVLASCYGWDEPTILDLSPARRRLYLEMASA